MGQMTVVDFVRIRVLPEFWPVVGMIRELMKECAPNALNQLRRALAEKGMAFVGAKMKLKEN
jgi:hypothetical protein